MAARLQPTVHRRGARIHCRGLGNLRGVIKELDRLYAGLGEHLEEETAFVIDGAIHETACSQPIRPGFKVFFIPKIEEIGAAPCRCCSVKLCPPSRPLVRADSGLPAAFISKARQSLPPVGEQFGMF
jgi:hypothetical protein